MSVSHSDSAKTYHKPGLPLIVVDNPHCHAVISVQGAHLVEFNRKNNGGEAATPFLWLSPNANFTQGTAIRGGIPICFPWFGPHAHNADLPKHGFARIRNWRLTNTIETAQDTKLCFALTSDHRTLQVYPYAFTAELFFTLGKTLAIELNVTNRSDSTMPVSWAFHSYFPVSNTAQISVPELSGLKYRDKTDNSNEETMTPKLDFSRHTDAVFNRTPDQITLVRPEGSLSIVSNNAPTTIAWNPNIGADTMGDLGPDTHPHFVCVERGAAFDDAWQLPAGESICASMDCTKVDAAI
jgi:glucose-6-phosphate 1-epimerase